MDDYKPTESDWDHVTVIKKRGNAKETFLSQQRAGTTQTIKKSKLPINTKYKKIDESTEVERHEKVNTNISKLIAKVRVEKGYNSQGSLAKALNIPKNIISDLENGKAIKDNSILGKIGRKLGVHLTGKNIGKPINKKIITL